MERNERIQKVAKAALAMQRWPWEQGVVAQAFLEMGEEEVTVLMAKDALLNQIADGRLGMKYERGAALDPASNGEPVLFAARATGDEKFKKAAERMLDYLLYKAQRTSEGILFHSENQWQVWVDAYYMAPPFLAVAGRPDEAVKQIVGFRSKLWNSEKKLFYHQWDDRTKDFSRKLFWGVGNGWAASGMARVIKALPDTMQEEKSMIAGYVKDVIDGCLHYQREDGLFHDIVDDPSTFIETNLAQMLSYSIYRGVQGGWLGREYIKQADRMREAVYKKVDDWGLVQGVCSAPSFDYSGVAAEGQAFFLLMEAAYDDMNKPYLFSLHK